LRRSIAIEVWILDLSIFTNVINFRRKVMQLIPSNIRNTGLTLGLISTLWMAGCGGGGSSTVAVPNNPDVQVAAGTGTLQQTGDGTLPSSMTFTQGVTDLTDPILPGTIWAGAVTAGSVSLTVTEDTVNKTNNVALVFVTTAGGSTTSYYWQKTAATGIARDTVAKTMTFTNTAVPGFQLVPAIGAPIALKTTATLNGTLKY
jgi:hypothetical protein